MRNGRPVETCVGASSGESTGEDKGGEGQMWWRAAKLGVMGQDPITSKGKLYPTRDSQKLFTMPWRVKHKQVTS